MDEFLPIGPHDNTLQYISSQLAPTPLKANLVSIL